MYPSPYYALGVETPFSVLTGEVLTQVLGMNPGSEHVEFITRSSKKFQMFHKQDCCESVRLESIEGDISDLLNQPILLAECVSSQKDVPYGSETWTFYKLQTVKGSLTLRWFGESNGYYSEDVNFELTPRR